MTARGALRAAALAVAAGLACATAAFARGPEGALAPADSLALHGRPDRAAAYADSLLRAAQAAGDRALEAVVASRRVLSWVAAGRLDEGAREARRVAALARAERDTLSWCRALLAEGRAHLFRDRLAEATPAYRALLPLARAIGHASLEGNARLGLAYLDLSNNRMRRAEAGYRAAIPLLERSDDTRAEMSARVGLARTQRARGRSAEARRSYEAIVERCRALGDRVNEADAWNNLGALAMADGDPVRATDCITRALQVSRAAGRPGTQEVRNLAILLVESGRPAAAAESLQAELARRPASAWRETYPLRTQLAVIRALVGSEAEAERLLREQWAQRDSVPLGSSADAAGQLAALLARTGRAGEGRAIALELERFAAGRREANVLLLAELDLDTGHDAEARARLRALADGTPAAKAMSWRDRTTRDVLWSRAYRSLGAPDSAVAAVRRAGDTWERTASGLRDAEWFEPVGNSAGQLALETARALLDARRGGGGERRTREAFDAVQRFKSRALEWRTTTPAGRRAPLVTAAALQRALAPGEVFVDAYAAAADTPVVFVIDRETVQAHWATDFADVVASLLRPAMLFASADPASAPVRDAALRRAAAGLFGPAAERVRRSRRVVTCLSGLLNALPIAALPEDSLGGPPLAALRTVTSVPSASWFVRRRAAGAVGIDSAQVVTIARTTDAQGRVLAGVREEAGWLRARYGGAGIVHDGTRTLGAVEPWLGRGAILHVASHARAQTQDAWGSAFLLGRGGGEDAWLTARTIARRRLPARLAVLASCRSSLDRGFNNESVVGLARAFLAAGVPTVVSAQWPVDDRATAEFTRRFYAGLEQGRTASESLRRAQEATRRDPATAAPYWWAGFTLSGDPDTRVRPRRAR